MTFGARSLVGVLAASLAVVPLAGTGASAAPGDLQHVPGSGAVENGVISGDGATVAWTAPSEHPDTGRRVRQVFARDLAAGTTVLVSATPSGRPGEADSTVTSVSDDGRFVAFTSPASDLVAGDSNAATDVFVRDVVAGTTRRASVATSGGQARGASLDGYLSGNGRRVAFTSAASNLVENDTNGAPDVFVHDLGDGTTRRASVGRGGRQSVRPTRATSLSADGRHVAFIASWASLTDRAAPHRFSVYVHDLPSARTERVSVDRRGGVPDGRSLGGSLSGDGRFAVFYSTASDLVTGDADRDFDVFVRDRRRDRTEQVSVGGRCGRGSSVTSWDGVISDNGRLVVFSADGAGCVRDRRRDENLRVQGAGQISGDGSRLLVRSPRPLLPQDSGSIWDLYVLDLR